MEDETNVVEISEQMASGGASNNASLLDALAARRDEIAVNNEIYLPIPGYDVSGITLLARYRLLSGEELEGIGRKVVKQYSKSQRYERTLYGSIDVMVNACTGIFYEMDGQRKQLTTNDGTPIDGFDENLAEALQFEADTARQCVLGVFCGNVVSLQTHNLMLGRWMSDTSIDVMSEMLEGNF
jgi:hypothetical protein